MAWNFELKSSKEYCDDMEYETRRELKMAYAKLKLALADSTRTAAVIFIYGLVAAVLLGAFIGILGFTVTTIDRFDRQNKINEEKQRTELANQANRPMTLSRTDTGFVVTTAAGERFEFADPGKQ